MPLSSLSLYYFLIGLDDLYSWHFQPTLVLKFVSILMFFPRNLVLMPVTVTYNLLLKVQPMSGNDVSESVKKYCGLVINMLM